MLRGLAILLFVSLLLASACSSPAALNVRISDLQFSPAPSNPITVAGRVSSESPLKLSDGRAEVVVTGLIARVGDFLIVRGDYADGTLAASQESGAVTLIDLPSMIEMIYVPAVAFLMGNNGSEPFSFADELPQHSVHLSGYWIGKYEVTRGQYRKFMEDGGYTKPEYWSDAGWSWKKSTTRVQPVWWEEVQDWANGQAFTQTDLHPVVGVNYYEAEAFCNWAHGRLPTEAQWEKAARWDGSPRTYPWGNVWDVEKCNNFLDQNPLGGGPSRSQTAPVGSYPSGASPYGVHDMSGNVWEWCRDWYSSTYYSQTPQGGWIDPEGPATGTYPVVRGGGWNVGDGRFTRASSRPSSNRPHVTWNSGGFRLAR